MTVSSTHFLSATAMALTGNRILCNCSSPKIPYTQFPLRRPFLLPIPSSTSAQSQRRRSQLFTVLAAKKFTSGKNKRSSISTKEPVKEEDEEEEFQKINISVDSATATVGDGFVIPQLPGEKPDFWEGPQWDGFGFFVQYLWAFGVLFSLIACGIAVATYNDGATDFKDTPVYKEAIQSKELLEEPEASDSDVFESNPTEDAPSLE